MQVFWKNQWQIWQIGGFFCGYLKRFPKGFLHQFVKEFLEDFLIKLGKNFWKNLWYFLGDIFERISKQRIFSIDTRTNFWNIPVVISEEILVEISEVIHAYINKQYLNLWKNPTLWISDEMPGGIYDANVRMNLRNLSRNFLKSHCEISDGISGWKAAHREFLGICANNRNMINGNTSGFLVFGKRSPNAL